MKLVENKYELYKISLGLTQLVKHLTITSDEHSKLWNLYKCCVANCQTTTVWSVHTHKQQKPTKTAAHTWKEAKPKNTYKICAMTENVAKEIVCWIVSLSTRAQGDYHNVKNTHNFKQLGNSLSHVGWRLGHLCEAQMQVVIYITQCCFKSTETVQTIRAGEPGTSTSSFTQLLREPGMSTSSFTQLLREPGMSTSSFIQLLREPGMSTSSFTQLLREPGMSTSSFTQLLREPGMSTSSFIQLLREPGMSTSSFTQLLREPGTSTSSFTQLLREPGTSTSSFTQLLSSGLLAIYISKTSY